MFNRDEAIKLTDPEELFPKETGQDVNESVHSELSNMTRVEKTKKKRPNALAFTLRKRVNAMM